MSRWLPAVHQYLLAASIYAAIHADWPHPVETLLVLAAGNALLWVMVTRRRSPAPPWDWRQAPWHLAAPAACLAAFSVYNVLRSGGALSAWLAEASIYALTALTAAAVLRSARDARPFLAALSAVSVALVVEGAWTLLARGYWTLIVRFEALRRNAQVEFDTIRMGGGALPYYNLLASLLIVLASASLGLAASASTRAGRALAVSAYLVSVFGVLLTGSRAGTVFLLLLTLAHAAYHRRRWLPAAALAGVAALSGVVVILALRPGGLLRGSASLRTRFHIWRVCLRIARDHPLLGGGPDAFAATWRVYGPPHGYGYVFTTVDGLYFDLLCVGGVPLLGAVLWLMGGILWEAARLIREAATPAARYAVFALTAGLAAMASHDIIEASLKSRPAYLLACVLAGMVVAWRGDPTPRTAVEWSGGSYRIAGGSRDEI